MAEDYLSLADTFTQEEIPIKLRCACCNKLNVNAFRLPCCDQNICESCHENLPESCPVCMHAPVSASDCKPNKALRLTVKAFLKGEEKKRDREAGAAAPLQRGTNEAVKSPQPTPTLVQKAEADESTEGYDRAQSEVKATVDFEEISPTEPHPGEGGKSFDPEKLENDSSLSETKVETTITADQPLVAADSENPNQSNNDGQQWFNSNFGFSSWNNNFNNGGWGNTSNFNPMMGMNTMSSNGWGGFPNTMGMPNMDMDPTMMSYGVFGGLNGQGLNMSTMNGMGMSFNGDFGAWGVPSAMSYGDMGGNGFGANAGYHPSNGYNQPFQPTHFNPMRGRQQFPMKNIPQTRPRGEFFGQKSRGFATGTNSGVERHDSTDVSNQAGEASGHHHASAYHEHGQENISADVARGSGVDSSHEALALEGEGNETGETADDRRQLSASDAVQNSGSIPTRGDEVRMKDETMTFSNPQPISTVIPSEPSAIRSVMDDIDDNASYHRAVPQARPLDPSVQVLSSNAQSLSDQNFESIQVLPQKNGQNNTHLGRVSSQESHLAAPTQLVARPGAAVTTFPAELRGRGVEGAPTGPKAMREGYANTGFRGRGGHGMQLSTRGGRKGGWQREDSDMKATEPIKEINSQHESRHHDSRHRSQSPEPRAEPRATDRKERSRSKSNESGSDYDLKRKRSQRKVEYNDKSDKRQRRRRKPSRESPTRHRAADAEKERFEAYELEKSKERRKRRRTPDSEVRDLQHVATKDTNDVGATNNRRDRRRDRDRKNSQKARSRSPSYEEHSRHYRDRVETRPESDGKSKQQEFKIKDRSKRDDAAGAKGAPEAKEVSLDAHTLEREARNRERMLKEQQRRETLTGKTQGEGQGNSLPGNWADQTGRKGSVHQRSARDGRKRRTAHRHDDYDEDRASRIENEREAARWT